MYPALPFPMAVEVHLLPIAGSWFLEECSVCKQLETANPDSGMLLKFMWSFTVVLSVC